MKIGLDRKILGGFVLCCVILAVVAVASFRNSDKFIDTAFWVTHTHEVLNECEQIILNEVEAEGRARGFVITGNEDFLEPFGVAILNVSTHLEKMRQLTVDNPTQQRNIARLEVLTHDHQAILKAYIEMRRQGSESAQLVAPTLESSHILTEIRTQVGAMRKMEEALMIARKQQNDDEVQNFSTLFIVLLGVMVVVLAVVYVIISSNLRNLRRLEKQSSDKNWILAGTGEVIRGMQGDKSVGELGHEVLRRLTRYLDIPLATFYVTESDGASLRLASSFASSEKDTLHPVIRFGEGFVGEVAAEKRTMILSGLHAEHYVVNTTFGAVRPQFILAFPFLFENVVIGVVELGSLKAFNEQQLEYLQRVSDSIAVAVMSSQARESAKSLLEETLRQAEELEVQQDELKKFNDELHAKTEMLERSEVELKAQQTELEHMNVDLEEKANQLSSQKHALQNAQTEIERKAQEVEMSSRYKSEFLANMSHELRTPLNSILILAQLLSENKNRSMTAKEVDFARNIHTSGTGLLNLINEILDLSKIEAGKMELDIEPVSVSGLAQTVQEMVSAMALAKSLTFNVVIDSAWQRATLATDHQRVEQILRNLLSNAIKFTPAGGTITLSVGAAPDNAVFKNPALQHQMSVVMFKVTDTGIGIAEAKRDLIFQAFQQADGSTKRKYGGTGLGLSISRELSSVLGGEIQLHSEEGVGSTFMLFLPATFDATLSVTRDKLVSVKERPERTPASHNLIPREDIALQANGVDDRHAIAEADKVVLVIEDDEKFAQVLLSFIHERGYKGVIASQGNTGVSYARHYRPVAILLDMNLPVMEGDEVIRQIKNDPDLRHIPVQIISAYDKKKEGMLLGAFDYLHKPVSIEDLRQAFDRIENFTQRRLKKLLIVEDNAQQNHAIREHIGGGDIKSVSAHSGEEAYALLQHERFDCMIIDLGLPDMTGFDLMEKIRANDTLNRIPIIVYTGKDLKKEDTQRLNKLADTVVLKTANSQERLLDETILFLHRVESQLPKEKQSIIRKLHNADAILKDKRILLVDDDIRNIYSLTNALEEEGLVCVTAENGKVALDILQRDPAIDLVLMDVMMPEMDGYEATQEIRKIDAFKKLPIIALTAKAMKGDKEKCLAVGMSDYVSKPVEVAQLLSLMRVWLYK
ncbi:response regulator [Chryseolinea lacunae]|uniref:histidine kinase n=1 Tax=Chryseolinea lacunae TaxID=2801331 RepID=A0ABS1KMW3_9BACT|nr:response regulator [Chryseolinea lacunae]MBL0740776.1 response regulator [Chryseolinea lacunae]